MADWQTIYSLGAIFSDLKWSYPDFKDTPLFDIKYTVVQKKRATFGGL